MPLYDFECRDCGDFSEFRTIADRDELMTCPVCGRPAARIVTAPNLALMTPLNRMAAVRNERSRHEPRVGMKTSCCSGGSCSHKRTKSKLQKDGDKPALRGSRKKNRRPWMLGH